MSGSDLLLVGVIALVMLVIYAVLIGFDDFRWYRKLRGGHWEKWAPGFVQPFWWIRSDTGRCSGDMAYLNGRRRVECEEW
jgi:hypothetical protein